MKIEVGKTYRTRGGNEATVIHDDGSETPFLARHKGATTFWHNPDGSTPAGTSDLSHRDLVWEIADPLTAPVDFAKYGVLPAEESMPAPATARATEAATDPALRRLADKVAPTVDAQIRSLRRTSIGHSIAIVILSILALLFAARAHAADIAWMPNNAGGEIVLTDEIAPDCADARVVFARAAGGRTLVGCYAYTESGYIAARFGSEVRTWRLEDFKLFDVPAARGTRL